MESMDFCVFLENFYGCLWVSGKFQSSQWICKIYGFLFLENFKEFYGFASVSGKSPFISMDFYVSFRFLENFYGSVRMVPVRRSHPTKDVAARCQKSHPPWPTEQTAGVSDIHAWGLMLPSSSRVSPLTYHSVVAVRYPDLCRLMCDQWQLGCFASGGIPLCKFLQKCYSAGDRFRSARHSNTFSYQVGSSNHMQS